MRVGIDARFLTYPQEGGFRTHTLALTAALSETDGSNEYILYTDRPDPKLSFPGNFRVTPVSGPNPIVREQFLLPAAMERDSVDLAHFPCNTAPVRFHGAMVVTVHDAIPLRERRLRSANLRQLLLTEYWRRVIPSAVKHARLVVTVSSHVSEELRILMGLKPEKLRVVPTALDPAFYADDPGTPIAGVSGPFLLAFANADGRKNQKGVSEAFQMIKEVRADLHLVFVCSHPDVRATIECADRMVPVGPVSLNELVWLYRNALALVFPSFDEGFGLPPMEAMASGTPVVASQSGSLAEVIGDCAVFVDPADTSSIAQGIRTVLLDDGLRTELITSGRARASLLSRVRMGKDMQAVYSSAIVGYD